jgi:uncharacterized protein (TIGR03083 family)
MTLLGHDRYCDEILRQTALLRTAIKGADPLAKVTTCPEWTLWELVRHVGGAHRWAEALVRTRATAYLSPRKVPGDACPDRGDPAALGAWLAEGAERLAETLREAGPDAEVWTWALEANAGFWARRMTHETVVHRADAELTAGGEFTVDPEVAADTIDEWLEILSSPQAVAYTPELSELKGLGKNIHLHATDTPAELHAEWVIEFGETGFTWRREHAKATAALRGRMADLLLDFWLDRTSFG